MLTPFCTRISASCGCWILLLPSCVPVPFPVQAALAFPLSRDTGLWLLATCSTWLISSVKKSRAGVRKAGQVLGSPCWPLEKQSCGFPLHVPSAFNIVLRGGLEISQGTHGDTTVPLPGLCSGEAALRHLGSVPPLQKIPHTGRAKGNTGIQQQAG